MKSLLVGLILSVSFCVTLCTDDILVQSTLARDKALFLTKYIEEGRLAEALTASEVTGLPGIGNQLKSYSGYLTVNRQFNSNLFFWFFPALNGNPNTPLLLWLEGGPGYPSLMGLFAENGPIQIDSAGSASLRNYTWNREFAVLYIDNPVGAGFSFADSDRGYARNQDDVARDLYEALCQFFTIFSHYRKNEFYLTGYSIAGKNLAAVGERIISMNRNAQLHLKINLKGLAIGAPYVDPTNQCKYGEFFYQAGLIDANEKRYFEEQRRKYQKLIKLGKYLEAFEVDNQLFNRFEGNATYFDQVTGSVVHTNMLLSSQSPALNYFHNYIALEATRHAIHVANQTFHNRTKVVTFLREDIPRSVKPRLETILNAGYPTLIYAGTLDLIAGAPLVDNLLQKLEWKGSDKFARAPKTIYRVGNATAASGYVRRADNLSYVVIRNVGHVAALDQPLVTLDLITRFVKKLDL